ncbi:protein kinase [Verrucomicrobiaceae bacterium 227]
MADCPRCQNPLRPLDAGGVQACPHCAMTSLFGEDEDPGFQDPGDYEIEEELGRGGDGTVYLCRDRQVGRHVAIKFVNFLRTSDETARLRFRSEVETIASLDHPHIIPIYANGEMGGRAFYTMKYLRGGSLAARRDRPCSAGEAVDLFSKIADAVQHAHERGILHRDLKPSNVLLDDRGEPYLSDFGLAKRHATAAQLTVTGSVMGTPAYMSPEQARGENDALTPSSDVFSLGSLFYFLLTGQHAFEGEHSHVILRQVIEGHPSFPELDRDLIAICSKCLEKDPGHRYVSAAELIKDLVRWENGKAVSARHLSIIRRVGRSVRRSPYRLGVLAAVGGLIGYLIVQSSEPIAAPIVIVAESDADYLSRLDQSLVAMRRHDFQEAKRLLDGARVQQRDYGWTLARSLVNGDQVWELDLSGKEPARLFEQGGDVFLATKSGAYFTVAPEGGALTPVPAPAPSEELEWEPRLVGGEVHLFKAGDGDDAVPFYRFPSLDHAVSEFHFSRDSRYFITVARAGNTHLQVRDLNSGKLTINERIPAAVQVTPLFDAPALTLFGDFPYFVSWNYHAETRARPFGVALQEGHFKRVAIGDDATYQFGPIAGITHLVSLPSGEGSLSLGADGVLRRWLPLRHLPGLDDSLSTGVADSPPALSHNGRFAFFRNFFELPELHDFQFHRSYPGLLQQSHLVALNDGRFLTVIDETGEISCWQIDDRGEVTWLWNHGSDLPGASDQRVIQSVVSSDEHRAVVLFPTGFLGIDLVGRESRFTPLDRIGSSISLTADASQIAVTAIDTTIFSEDGVVVIPRGNSDHRICRFTPDGKFLLIANAGGAVSSYLLNGLSKGPVWSWKAHSTGVTALTISRDGRAILTGGDSSIRVWDPDHLEKPRLTVPTESSPAWLQFCNDDALLFHLNQLGTIETLPLIKP